MISIYTFTLGRDYYLKNLVNSIERLGGHSNYEHHICFQGVEPSREIKSFLEHKDEVTLHQWEENVGIAEGMNTIIPLLKGDLIIKMDDDCVIRSGQFFKHIEAVSKLFPQTVFSPYPVGLINNPGGPRGHGHVVKYSEDTETWYTLRMVQHVGGFSRVSPRELVKDWVLTPDLIEGQSGNEDGQHSSLCLANGIPMAYLENAIIVEHQESTLGQHQRYGEEYFSGRF